MITEAEGPGAMPVSAFVADAVAAIAPDASLVEVADALHDSDVGALVVARAAEVTSVDEVIGIVSERDLVKALAQRLAMDTTPVRDIATTELAVCDAGSTVAEVAEEMCERYVRHVLVEEGGHLVGIVSARDLLGVYAAADVELE